MAPLISLFALFVLCALVYRLVGIPIVNIRADLRTIRRLSKLGDRRD
ncbi:hypothetical protein [Nocardiopsis sp. CNR-923]|nr:hypothetical protein [Nocardiopsis sp. CNR-923]